jgi:hypothetical protein
MKELLIAIAIALATIAWAGHTLRPTTTQIEQIK